MLRTGDHSRVVNNLRNSRHQSRGNGDDQETVDQLEGKESAEEVQLQFAGSNDTLLVQAEPEEDGNHGEQDSIEDGRQDTLDDS